METLYAEVADKILAMIEKGALKEGDRVPSIRSLSGQLEVSVNTVKEAYLLLESQRFLEARPQSGFYVRRKAPPLPLGNESNRAYLEMNPKEVSLCRIYGEISKTEKGSGACLSVAIPDHSLMPATALERAFKQVLAEGNHEAINYSFSPGFESLRREIARHSIESGVNASPEDIIITSGASEALTLTIMALCGRGDTVAVESVLSEGIAFSPGAVFSNSGKYSNCLRLNAGQWNEETRRAVARIGELALKGAN